MDMGGLVINIFLRNRHNQKFVNDHGHFNIKYLFSKGLSSPTYCMFPKCPGIDVSHITFHTLSDTGTLFSPRPGHETISTAIFDLLSIQLERFPVSCKREWPTSDKLTRGILKSEGLT